MGCFYMLLHAGGLTIWKITKAFKYTFANGMLTLNRNTTHHVAKGPGSDIKSMYSRGAGEDTSSAACSGHQV